MDDPTPQLESEIDGNDDKERVGRKCSVSCELMDKTVQGGGLRQINSAIHDVTTGHTHHICYKSGCSSGDSIGCECYCDCSDDGTLWFYV